MDFESLKNRFSNVLTLLTTPGVRIRMEGSVGFSNQGYSLCPLQWKCKVLTIGGGGGLVVKSCPTLFNSMDCSLAGSSVHGISQARIRKWVAMPFSRASSRSKDWTQVSCIAGGFFTNWASRKALLTTGLPGNSPGGLALTSGI